MNITTGDDDYDVYLKLIDGTFLSPWLYLSKGAGFSFLLSGVKNGQLLVFLPMVLFYLLQPHP